MNNPIVTVDHFRMKFGDNEVIKDLNFDVQRGETFGFLGSNGSGKTTSIRVILDIYKPDAGRVEVLGGAMMPDGVGNSHSSLPDTAS